MANAFTSKDPVTIPKPVRDLLGIRPGSQVAFAVGADGQVELRLVGAARPARAQAPRRCWRLRVAGDPTLLDTSVQRDLATDEPAASSDHQGRRRFRTVVCKLLPNARDMDSIAYTLDEASIQEWFRARPFNCVAWSTASSARRSATSSRWWDGIRRGHSRGDELGDIVG